MLALFGVKKTPEEMIASALKHLKTLDEVNADDSDYTHANEKVTKNLHLIKINLLGEIDVEVDEAVREHVMSLLSSHPSFFSDMLKSLSKVEFEARKDIANILNIVMRKGNVVQVMEHNPDIIQTLVDGYDDAVLTLHCGNMLRELLRHDFLTRRLLFENNAALFLRFFDFVCKPNFDQASDAFDTFKCLLTKHKNLVLSFLETYYESVIDGFHHLITSDNYVTKRQSIKLLGEVLLERTNFNVMMRYINDPENLKLMMTLLKGESKNIQTEAFHVFKVFVANPNKSDAVAHILYANRQRLIVFLSNFKTSEKESAQIKEEKDILLATLQNMAEPPGYEAISPMVTPPPQ